MGNCYQVWAVPAFVTLAALFGPHIIVFELMQGVRPGLRVLSRMVLAGAIVFVSANLLGHPLALWLAVLFGLSEEGLWWLFKRLVNTRLPGAAKLMEGERRSQSKPVTSDRRQNGPPGDTGSWDVW